MVSYTSIEMDGTGKAVCPGASATAPTSKHPFRKLNLVFLGEKQTGKTLLLNRFLRETTSDEKFKVKVDQVHRTLVFNEANLEIHLINTAGKEKCRSTIKHYIKSSTVFIILYDITARKTFDATTKWIDIVRSEHGEDSIIILVGNKSELADRREVYPGDGERMAKELKVAFIETSAVAGPNLKILFREVIDAAQQLDFDIPDSIHKNAKEEHGCTLM